MSVMGSIISAPRASLVRSPLVPQPFQSNCKHWLVGGFGLYWVLCERRFPRERVAARLVELAAAEAQLLAGLHREARMHS